MILGKETIPIILGERRTKIFLIYLSVVLATILLVSGLADIVSESSYYQLVVIVYLAFHLFLKRLTVISRRIVYEMMVDSTFLLSGLIALIYSYIS